MLLGLGGDGHCLSWFPYSDGLQKAIDPSGASSVAAIRARPSATTGAYLDRMTLTLPEVARARRNVLMITGDEKRQALEDAADDGLIEAVPVRALLRSDDVDLEVYWSP